VCSSHLFGLVWQLNFGLLNDGHNNGLNPSSGPGWWPISTQPSAGDGNAALHCSSRKRCWPSMKVGGLRPIVGAFLYFASEMALQPNNRRQLRA
jgi:hypothetical protein